MDGVTSLLGGIGKLLGGIGGMLSSTPRGTHVRLTQRTDGNSIRVQDWKLPSDDMASYWERVLDDCYHARDEEAFRKCIHRSLHGDSNECRCPRLPGGYVH